CLFSISRVVTMCSTPRTIAFFFQMILLVGLTCSFLVHNILMIMEDERHGSILDFPNLPHDFPVKTHQLCLPDQNETSNFVNIMARTTGFQPVMRLFIVFISLTGLLYYIVELTYFPFIMVAFDLLGTTLGTIFYIYKHYNHIFHDTKCFIPASLRLLESMVILTNFVLLSLACLYIVKLTQCRVIVEEKYHREYSFILGSKGELKIINKIVGYETRRKSRNGKSGRSSRATASSIKSRSTKSQSGSVSSRSTRSDNSRSDP
ncbi:hypothetical protein PENTCL1PPCAC_26528, partial [Pristionchus entomophagus]